MAKRAWTMFALCAALAAAAFAQDAKAVLDNATKTMGNPSSIQYSGAGKAASLGQSLTPSVAWPTLVVTSYSRTIDYASASSKEEVTRTYENPPAPGGGAPFQGDQKQVNLSSGQYAWNQPGAQPQPAAAAADERLLQVWMTPHGFIQGAMANNATAKKVKGGTEVSFKVNNKFTIQGLIDAQGMVTKTETWIPNPVLGDLLIETDYSDYKDFSGVKFPSHIVQKQGGYMVLDLNVANAQPNVASAALTVPDSVKNAPPPGVHVESSKLGDGVWFIGGGTHNSVVVEFKDYITVIEAPNSEERSLAVIAEAKRLAPNKPIKYLINTHHHWDHSSGIRTYVAEGATVITQEVNKQYYEQSWKKPRTLAPDKLAQSPRKATFITVKDKYTLTDGTQTIDLHLLLNDKHNGDMLFAYLPKQKVLVEADNFTPPAGNASIVPLAVVFGNNLYDQLQQLKLDIETIAPLHGNVAPYSALPKALGKT
jgi:glyoxylase-like metal-dependent hydrolase (beta-lactamase superfamily II)